MTAISAVGLAYRHHSPYMAIFIAWTSGWAAGIAFSMWCERRWRAAAFDKADKKGDWTTVTVAECPDIKTGDVLILDQQSGRGVKITDVAKDLKDKKESV